MSNPGDRLSPATLRPTSNQAPPPTTPLEVALTLPVGDEGVVQALLGARVVEVVVDDLVAEGATRHRSLLEGGDRFTHRRWEPVRIRLVGVALEARRELELLLDPVQAGGDHGREREVGVRVAAGDPRLGAPGRSVPDDAEPTRAVVVPPRERRRRP